VIVVPDGASVAASPPISISSGNPAHAWGSR
jgi:hypothetical protein